MKTCLYNPVFINPLAYFVFPLLYDIQPKIDDYTELAIFAGTLAVFETGSHILDIYNGKVIDLLKYAGKTIDIVQHTEIGSVLLGRWNILGEPKPVFHKSLVDAWFMSGYSNSNHPTSIDGINSTKTYPVNFKEIYGTKNNIQEHKVTLDAVNNFVSNSGDLNEGDTFTIPSYTVKVTGMIDIMMTIGYEDNTGQHFLITIQKDGIYTVPAHTFSWSEFMPVWVTSIATYFHGDGDFPIITIEEVAEDKVNTLALKNFAFAQTSGFGKYAQNYNKVTGVNYSKTDSKIIFNRTGGGTWLGGIDLNKYDNLVTYNLDIDLSKYSFPNISLLLTENNITLDTIKLYPGVNSVRPLDASKVVSPAIARVAFSIDGVGEIVVEQIPEYEGALVYDGVDDYCICDTIPALSDYTAIYKREYVNPESTKYAYLASLGVASSACTFWIEGLNNSPTTNLAASLGKTGNVIINKSKGVNYQNSNSYNGQRLTTNPSYILQAFLFYLGALESSAGIPHFQPNVAIYYFALYDKSLTPEEIEEETIKLEEEWSKRLNEITPPPVINLNLEEVNYVIVTIEWCSNKGIVVPTEARKSIDGSKVILHYDFIEPVLVEGDAISIYSYDSAELNTILNSSDWVIEETINE